MIHKIFIFCLYLCITRNACISVYNIYLFIYKNIFLPEHVPYLYLLDYTIALKLKRDLQFQKRLKMKFYTLFGG